MWGSVPSQQCYLPVPFDSTYIMYDPKDMVSMLCVHFSLLPIYLMVFYFAWFVITREIEPVLVVAGHLVGEAANKVVKHILKRPRPDYHRDFGKNSYGLRFGMPSAHSQFMGLFAAYWICITLYRIPHLRLSVRLAMASTLAICSCLVGFSRVYLFYHTPPQVMVGLMVGLVIGLLLFVFTSLIRDVGLVDWVLRWPLVHYFYIKDSYYHCYVTYKEEYDEYLRRKSATKPKSS